MSRKYGVFSTDIWQPEDTFVGLSRDAQWAYFMLSTQKDISAAGVLSLNVKRWASRARDTSRADIVAALRELSAGGKVVYDTETEELLVVTFVDDDNGYGNRKRRPVIERAARAIESLAVRRALGREFVRLGLPVEWVRLTEADLVDPEADPDRVFSQVDTLCQVSEIAHAEKPDGASRFDGVVVTEVGVVTASTLNPQSVPPPAAPADTAVADDALFTSPTQPAPAPSKNDTRNRAFGIARWWMDLREAADTPVIATGGGKDPGLHKLRSLIEPFTAAYTDEEIKQAFEEIRVSIPAAARLDSTLAQIRTNARNQQQGRQPNLPARYEPRGGAARWDQQGPRENANSRNAEGWLSLPVSGGAG
ncbi:hypothetical protein [Verrucosispora sp. NA02020]|uniref:hypothetical protein n=1 Tax=Verrucosispora sp. NA02020 TaxID=2742132 RepID=UPI001590C84E|nr:hypothetical protein [Verrucosispora sp. NA02020]QKW15348.1 hypothetical protein HUT12_23015 [Verrucosispora sp. NA02020]